MYKLALALTCLIGCSCPHTVDLDIDPSFTPSEQAAYRIALADWVTASDGRWQLTEGEEKPRYVIHVENVTPPEGRAGWTCGDTILYRSHSVDDIPLMKFVALHEVGHALGLPHYPGGVMADPYEGDLELTPVDVEAIRASR